jgi:hypothetical protein
MLPCCRTRSSSGAPKEKSRNNIRFLHRREITTHSARDFSTRHRSLADVSSWVRWKLFRDWTRGTNFLVCGHRIAAQNRQRRLKKCSRVALCRSAFPAAIARRNRHRRSAHRGLWNLPTRQGLTLLADSSVSEHNYWSANSAVKRLTLARSGCLALLNAHR